VGPVHLEFFPSEEAIAHEKAAVLRALSPDGLAVLPADDPWFATLKSHLRSRLLTTSLRGEEADYSAERLDGHRFLVREQAAPDQVELVAPLPGDYIVHDALLAVAVGRYFGVSWERIRAALAAYQPLSLRWQREEVDGVFFINDAYNANPMSMRAALQAFAQTAADGGRWLVLAGMRELGERAREEHLRLGRDLAGGPWAGLVTVGRRGRVGGGRRRPVHVGGAALRRRGRGGGSPARTSAGGRWGPAQGLAG
jgi:UDP-N-acetylmuramoyl-tripeptide--D-alanyl-D-alanine ligase